MGSNYTPPTFTGGIPSSSKLTEAFQEIDTAFDDTLSRTNQGSNEMDADLDMNGNRIINVGGINGILLTTTEYEALENAIATVQGNLDTVEQTLLAITTGLQNQINNLPIPSGDDFVQATGTYHTFTTASLGLTNLESPTSADFLAVLAANSDILPNDIVVLTTPLLFEHEVTVLDGVNSSSTISSIRRHKVPPLSSLPATSEFALKDEDNVPYQIEVFTGNEKGIWEIEQTSGNVWVKIN